MCCSVRVQAEKFLAETRIVRLFKEKLARLLFKHEFPSRAHELRYARHCGLRCHSPSYRASILTPCGRCRHSLLKPTSESINVVIRGPHQVCDSLALHQLFLHILQIDVAK